MSILGAVARLRPQHLPDVLPRLALLPGVEVALNPGDGRLVLVLEDAVHAGLALAASSTLSTIGTWPEMISVTLVYEYSGPDAPELVDSAVTDFKAWRGGTQAEPETAVQAHSP
jgi:nitrate reductase NapD